MCDEIAVSVFKTLVKDFRLIHGENFASGALKAISAGICEFRAYEFPQLGVVPPNRFKAMWQLQHLLKRYRFNADLYTDDELKERTLTKYTQFSEQRSKYTPLKSSTLMVLREARKICKAILCLPYVPGESCRNGVKSTRSVPLRKAFLDEKWGTVVGFDCPSALRKEFLELLGTPHSAPVAKRLLSLSKKSGIPLNLSADDLNLILVDKSWKVLRPITPLSVFGLFWSFGVGSYVEKCLRISNLDITRLQRLHQKLARRYSESLTHATTDLTSASESIRRDHLNRVLPRWFYRELRKTFINHLNIGETQVYTSSCLPMGNGATFPVETLYFYCLIKAIGNLLKVKGTYSVYGDDLIYPVRIHSYVSSVFADLGIGINGDKTFVHSNFRESCGGDYYQGIDVRPAMLPAERADVTKRLTYCSWLYKVVNSLLRRWDKTEIPHTYALLLSEIAYTRGEIHQVPPSFPDSSGIQVEKPEKPTWLRPFILPRYFFEDGSCYLQVKFIGESPSKRRKVAYEDIYYWDKLGTWKLSDIVPPPHVSCGWGRYRAPGMTRELAKWFLKSITPSNGEAREHGLPILEETGRDAGKTKISVSRLETWK